METKKFKCKDEVIYQNRVHFGDEKLTWNYGIVNYEDEDEGYVYLVGGLYINKKMFKVLPYEGNEELVGTSDKPEEEVRLEKGEWIIVFGNMSDFEENDDYCFAKFISVEDEKIYASNKIIWPFAIRFSDFNPNNMEETKKHILCVKNGKVVKYRE